MAKKNFNLKLKNGILHKIYYSKEIYMDLKNISEKDILVIKNAPSETTHIDIIYLDYWDLSSKCPYLFNKETGIWEYENLNYEPKESLRHIDDLKYILGI